MYRFALKMLTGDLAKYLLLVSALSFTALLMTQQTSVFLGLTRWSTSTIRNTQSKVWVMDPVVEQVNEVQAMRDTNLSLVRSVEGVKWAAPMSSGILQAKFGSKKFKSIQLIGIDGTTFIGAPPHIISGRLEDLRQTDAVFIDEEAMKLFNLGIGDSFEINDHNAKVVGVFRTDKSFFGYPYVYTSYERAKQFAPMKRKNLSFVLADVEKGASVREVLQNIEKQTGLQALTDEEFSKLTLDWIYKNTGIPISFGATIFLAFLVGIAVSGQTFYAFILENLPHLGALKAMGASNGLLRKMLLLQALFVGTIGYGIGVGLTALFGHFAYASKKIPFYMPPEVLLRTLIAILLMCSFAALLGIYRVQKLDPAEVFRA